jgi:transcriptional regulator with PAS, ATPase and Fis domain
VRIICATTRDAEQQVQEGKFREDLYYRINILRVHLPSLRERSDCIEPLCRVLLEKISRNLKKKMEGFSPQTLDAFRRYAWPGNIRQLANVIERAVILEESQMIQTENAMLPASVHVPSEPELPHAHRVKHSIEEHEKEMILKALEQCLWVQKDAAKRLGITARTLNYKIEKFGITHARWRKNR